MVEWHYIVVTDYHRVTLILSTQNFKDFAGLQNFENIYSENLSKLLAIIQLLVITKTVGMKMWSTQSCLYTSWNLFIAPAYTYIDTLNNYACLLPPLANVNWCAFIKYFLLTM